MYMLEFEHHKFLVCNFTKSSNKNITIECGVVDDSFDYKVNSLI
jgi:hypothetical protein